ncbi:MAG: hypothetical protein U5K53_02670 [Halanaerobiales bacterium]|nr:hypothetical protein [Halanaerobiales bacterium]
MLHDKKNFEKLKEQWSNFIKEDIIDDEINEGIVESWIYAKKNNIDPYKKNMNLTFVSEEKVSKKEKIFQMNMKSFMNI